MLKENAGQKTQLIYRKLKLLITENFKSHFKVTLTIRTIKPTWWNTFSKKWRELLPHVLTSCQTICLANLDGATDRAVSQNSEKTGFYCDQGEADTKIFAYIRFLCDNIRLNRIIIVSPDTDVTVISLYKYAFKLVLVTILLASDLGLSIYYFLPAMHAISRYDFVSSFSRTGKVTDNIQNIEKQFDELTNQSNNMFF